MISQTLPSVSQPQPILGDCDEALILSAAEVKAPMDKNLDFTSSTSHHFCRHGNNVVTFNESVNVSYSNSLYSKEDAEELWYSGDDYQRFKSDFAGSVSEIIRIEKENKRKYTSYHNVMERVYLDCCLATQVSDIDKQNFQKWVSVAISRIGLEKTVVRNIRQDKPARRGALLEVVFNLQEDSYHSPEQRSEIIACAAQKISQPSCLFATLLGQAQALSS